MVEAKKYIAKFVLLGDVNVGKTTLINKFIRGDQPVPASQATLAPDFQTKKLTIDGREAMLQIWDTAGQEKHSAMGFAFYRGTQVCILTFDLSSPESFGRLGYWKQNFLDQAQPQNASTFPFIVVGNKNDLERRVTSEQAQAWCSQNGGYKYFETCATSGEGVINLFTASGREAI